MFEKTLSDLHGLFSAIVPMPANKNTRAGAKTLCAVCSQCNKAEEFFVFYIVSCMFYSVNDKKRE